MRLWKDLMKLLAGVLPKVKWATSETLGRKVALKIINRKRAPYDFQQKFMPRELDVLKMLQHPNIIRMYDVYYFNDKVQ